MNKTEVKKLFLIINNCYQNFQIDNTKVAIWQDILKDFSFEQAQINLRKHIQENKFPPTIADIVRHDPNQFTDHERLKAETEGRFAQMRQWEQQAIPCPEHLRPKFLKSGDSR